jgi:hypothetical protein
VLLDAGGTLHFFMVALKELVPSPQDILDLSLAGFADRGVRDKVLKIHFDFLFKLTYHPYRHATENSGSQEGSTENKLVNIPMFFSWKGKTE